MPTPLRLRILISAYYCSPYRGGESAVGWRVATELAKHHDVTVICGDISRAAPTAADHERYRKENGLTPNLQIIHIQAKGISRMIHRLHRIPGLWFLFYEAYRRWQLQALETARTLHREHPFDVAHHLNVIGFREPGYLWQLGIPFFWGPISGAPMVPPSFLRDFSSKEKFRWGSRNLLNKWQIRHPGRAAKAARAAAWVWTVSQEDLDAVTSWGASAHPMLETGCATPQSGMPPNRREGDPLRLCWSGLFQGIKALPVLLQALADLGDVPVTLDILGNGPEESHWKAMSLKLGLDRRIIWHGMISRDQALEVMKNSHALVHTSVKEGTPHVVLEALSLGKPILCHDACGMGIAVDDRCGIKIPLRDPKTSIAGFREAIRHLLTEPDLLATLSAGAYERAAELSWESKVEAFSRAYIDVTKNRT